MLLLINEEGEGTSVNQLIATTYIQYGPVSTSILKYISKLQEPISMKHLVVPRHQTRESENYERLEIEIF